MDKKEVLYTHYVETCSNAKRSEEKRNKLFIAIGVIIGVLILFSTQENSVMKIIQQVLYEKYGCDILFPASVIQTIISFALLFCTLRYCTINVSLDREYEYIHSLEEKINKEFNQDIINREGKMYLNNYPIVQNMMYYMYRGIVPILYIFIITIKFINDISCKCSFWQILLEIICDTVIVMYFYENMKYIVRDIRNSIKNKRTH